MQLTDWFAKHRHNAKTI